MSTLKFNSNSSADIILFDDLAHCAKLTSKHLLNGNVAISGGSTYTELFRYWCESKIPISATFFPVDERVVPFDDPQSNWGIAYNNFLKLIGRESDKQNFPTSIKQYTSVLKNHFKNSTIIFDTIFLGVGDDGHTASLFPNGDYFEDRISTVLDTISPKPPTNRITLAPKPLSSANQLITIIYGSNKIDIVKKILANDIEMPIVKILSQRAHSQLIIHKSLLS